MMEIMGRNIPDEKEERGKRHNLINYNYDNKEVNLVFLINVFDEIRYVNA